MKTTLVISAAILLLSAPIASARTIAVKAPDVAKIQARGGFTATCRARGTRAIHCKFGGNHGDAFEADMTKFDSSIFSVVSGLSATLEAFGGHVLDMYAGTSVVQIDASNVATCS